MAVENVLAGVAVTDLKAAVEWYTRLLDRYPEPVPPDMEGLAEWRFPNGGCLQLFQDDKRAGLSSTTFAVSDLAAQRNALCHKKIPVVSSSESPHVAVAIVHDPDRNQLVFAQAFTPHVAR